MPRESDESRCANESAVAASSIVNLFFCTPFLLLRPIASNRIAPHRASRIASAPGGPSGLTAVDNTKMRCYARGKEIGLQFTKEDTDTMTNKQGLPTQQQRRFRTRPQRPPVPRSILSVRIPSPPVVPRVSAISPPPIHSTGPVQIPPVSRVSPKGQGETPCLFVI
ncbi:hypothetical protein LX36DRAFT_742028 [Colletotrichum falcatum]|nr:hypothetical protein LX36DRAFT_742028 [Colletotrichum falcatum]